MAEITREHLDLAALAAGMAGRMVRRGLLMPRIDDYSTVYWRPEA